MPCARFGAHQTAHAVLLPDFRSTQGRRPTRQERQSSSCTFSTMKVLQVSSRIQEARSTSLQDSTGHIYDKGTQHYAQKNYLLEGEKNKFFCYTDVTSIIKQVTRVVSVRLWSSDKALKLFQKVSGLDSSFFPGFPGLLDWTHLNYRY